MSQINLFPNFVEIDLTHKNVLDTWFSKYQQTVSELNFVELFIWKNSYKTYLSILNDNLCIFVTHYNDKYFYPLIGNNEIKLSLQKMYDYAQQNNFCLKFKSVTKDFLSKITGFKNVVVEEDFCFYDYLYKTSDLINLAGEKFHPKRNLIRQFNSKYKFDFLPVTKGNIESCISFAKKWYEKMKPTKYLHKDFSVQDVESDVVYHI
ncbi:MAG: phosphatidylglycerol lysyltransferase domain-containing protein [Endomicrobiia bacterium]